MIGFPAFPSFRLSKSDVYKAGAPGALALHVDMTAGYHQVPVHPAMRRFFAFLYGVYGYYIRLGMDAKTSCTPFEKEELTILLLT